MDLAIFVVKRLISSIITIAVIIAITFFIINLAPGDPAALLAGEAASPEYLNTIRKSYGLDKPLFERFYIYVVNLLMGNWGFSLSYQMQVIDAILNRLPQTLLLVGSALILGILVGTFLGVISATKENKFADILINSTTLTFYSIPVFWLGLLLILFFSVYYPVFPTGGLYDIGIDNDPLVLIPNILWHMVLPVITLSTIFVATYARISRSVMIDVLKSSYVIGATARGLPRRIVLYRYALRNALIPIIAVAGSQFGQIISGAVLTETVYSWPGMGTLLVQALSYRDYPLITGILVFTGIAVSISNFISDLAMSKLDPRVRKGLMGKVY